MVATVTVGPLVPYEALLRMELTRVGYAPLTVNETVRSMARLSAWMLQRDLTAAGLTSPLVEQFLIVRRARCRVEQAACVGIRTVLRTLRAASVVPERCAIGDTPADMVLTGFRGYLVAERGLAAATVRSYTLQARKFLAQMPEPLIETLSRLDAAMVTSFVVREAAGATNVASAKALVTALRALLRYLHVEGFIPGSLVGAIPAVAGWRLSSLPRGLDPEQVKALLAATDVSGTRAGLRDHAVLTVLARLGLRGGEAAALMLEDVDWRSGQILVRGKGSRVERLPMLVEVGEALSAYLLSGRPQCSCRTVFVTARPPYQGLSGACVREIMARACRKAGLPRLGAHRLRHTLATQMLRKGAPLAEIGQVLRHRSQLATAIYAKVDYEALRMLARPWPAGA